MVGAKQGNLILIISSRRMDRDILNREFGILCVFLCVELGLNSFFDFERGKVLHCICDGRFFELVGYHVL